MQQDIKTALWAAANTLRGQMDSSDYKHIVLGLIFLKHISDNFDLQRERIKATVSDKKSDFYEEGKEAQKEALEDKDHYTKDSVFWVPAAARWERLQAQATQPNIGEVIDSAMTAIEGENERLRDKLDKRYGGARLQQGTLGALIDLISSIGLGEQKNDLLGEVYEYFLGQFASAEGKRGGEFYTPSSIVRTLVAVLSPHKGRVYDPCCGSGGMFVQSERFVESHGGRLDDISIYGQEKNQTTWHLAAMNTSIRGFWADLGKEPADTFANDQFRYDKFNYIMANPPFNISDWGGKNYGEDPRWKYGRPPNGNANYAWLQHILWKLRPSGKAGVVLANGSMSGSGGGEGQIREAMARDDVVEIMVALPGQLFSNTQIPACLWFLTNDKSRNKNDCDRREKTLFIDARQLGAMQTRVLKVFRDEDIAKIANTAAAWKKGKGYKDIAGFCKSATLAEIEENDFILTPGRYVGMPPQEEDGEPFDEKMARLTAQLQAQFAKSGELDAAVKKSLSHVYPEAKK